MFPESIPGEALTLRLLTAADIPALLAFLNLPEVIEPTSSEGWTEHSLRQFCDANLEGAAEGRWCRYGILLPASEAPVGTVGLFNVDLRNRRVEIGYDLAPTHWGTGLMTRSASALLAWAFGAGFHRIEATVMDGNTRSERVLERLDFTREGHLRDYKFARNAFRNYSLWSFLAPGP